MEANPNHSDFQLPPGFRFRPSDEELILYYLRNKVTSSPLPASIITDIDLYKYNPWDLPEKAMFGEDEWYFFTPRDRKYPNGTRPNRAAGSGYWKATGTDKPILTSCGGKSIGVKKGLVFYNGHPPKGLKTDWIMHEFRLQEPATRVFKQKRCMRLDDWVLCRVRQKGNTLRSNWEDQNVTFCLPVRNARVAEEPWSTRTKASLEMVANYLYKECPMLTYMLASQSFPCSNSDCKPNTQSLKKKSLKFSVIPSLDCWSLNRKVPEGNVCVGFSPLNRKINDEDDQSEEVSYDGNVMTIHNTDQPGSSNSNPRQHYFRQYQELT